MRSLQCSHFLLVLLLWTKYGSGQERTPAITTGGWLENEFGSQWNHNISIPVGTSPYPNSLLVPSNVKGMSLICNASYPIEWKFHRDQWGGRSRLQFAIQSTRQSQDNRPIGYSTELSFFSFESNSVSGNYTCQKVGYSGLSSSMYIFFEGNSPPYLTLANSYRRPPTIPYRNESKSFILPCTVSVPTITPTLTRQVGDKEVPIPPGSVPYDPRIGFTMSSLPDPYGRYTCQVGDVEEDGDGDIITFLVVNADDGPKPEFNETLRHGAYYHIDSVKKEITCCGAGGKAPKLKHVGCDHPSICALAKHTLHSMESPKKRNGSCSILSIHALRAGVFRCVGGGIDVVREYFYPIPEVHMWRPGKKGHGPEKNATTTKTTTAIEDHVEPYYDWNEADPQKMMLVTKVTRPVYVGENRTFVCRVSPFYYAQGIVWGVSFGNESMQYFDGKERIKPHNGMSQSFHGNRHFKILFGQNEVTLDITIVENLQSIVCSAPIWNSTGWGEKALNIQVKSPTPAQIVGKKSEEVTWYLNDTKKVLECKFTGEPIPTVLWKKGNRTLALHTDTGNDSSTLTFNRVSLNTHADYECIVTNGATTVIKHFRVVVSQSSSAFSAILILSIVGFVIISIALVFMCNHLKSQKSVISHLANLAFKDVSSDTPNSTNRAAVSVDNGLVLPAPPSTHFPNDLLNKDNKGFLFHSQHLEHHNGNNSHHPAEHPDHDQRASSPSLSSFTTYKKF